MYRQIEEAQPSPTKREHTCFSITHGAFTKRACLLGHRKALVHFEELRIWRIKPFFLCRRARHGGAKIKMGISLIPGSKGGREEEEDRKKWRHERWEGVGLEKPPTSGFQALPS